MNHMNRSYPIDGSLYPLTARLLEHAQLNPPTPENARFNMLAAATSRVIASASLAMDEGDMATVFMMAEVFSRVALSPYDASNPKRTPLDGERMTYYVWAILDCAYGFPAFEPDTVAKYQLWLAESSEVDELSAPIDWLRKFKADCAEIGGLH